MKTINIYTFEELNDKAKQFALNKAEFNDVFWEMEDLREYFINELKKIGFNDDVKVYFNFNNCQGDGICFEGYINLCCLSKEFFLLEEYDKILQKIFKTDDSIRVEFKCIGRDTHYKNIDFEFMDTYTLSVNQNKFIDDVIYKYVKHWIKDICFKFEEHGYKEIEYYSSDEYKIDDFINNEIYFLKDGTNLGSIYKLEQKEVI